MPSFTLARHRLILLLTFVLFCASTPAAVTAATPQMNWTLLDRTLESISIESNLLVAEFSGSTCDSIHERNADRSLAIASTFKLYVLGELSRQILQGTAAWDDRIPLTSDLRSMPAGDFAFVAEGTEVSVLDLAEAMIGQSDNTATDHLIDYLGRENVYHAFAAFGHTDPEVNNPLLLTRELFAIKMTKSSSWMTTYMAADDSAQLDLLHDEIDPLRIDPTGDWGLWNGPTAIDGIEWFASASDLCRATASLWTLGAQSGLHQVRDILAGNRGAVDDRTNFPQAGYKGGYEAGVVNMTYVLEREDGRVFFVSAGYNSDSIVIETGPAMSHLVPVFACIAEDACISEKAGEQTS